MTATTSTSTTTISNPHNHINDPIEPQHYRYSHIQPIHVIDAWNLNFCLGNTIKYIARHQRHTNNHPPQPSERSINDLKKALWYLQYAITKLEQRPTSTASNQEPTP